VRGGREGEEDKGSKSKGRGRADGFKKEEEKNIYIDECNVM